LYFEPHAGGGAHFERRFAGRQEPVETAVTPSCKPAAFITAREAEVPQLIPEGLANKQIAADNDVG